MCNAAYEQPNGAAVTDIAYLHAPRAALSLKLGHVCTKYCAYAASAEPSLPFDFVLLPFCGITRG